MKRALPGPLKTHGAVADDDLAVAGDELVECRDAVYFGAAAAARAARRVRDAALLRAIGEDRLQRGAVETRDRDAGEPLVDRQLVACMHDLGDRYPAPR